MLKRDRTTPSSFINHSTLDSEVNLEVRRIQVEIQQTYASNYHNQIMGGPTFNLVFDNASS